MKKLFVVIVTLLMNVIFLGACSSKTNNNNSTINSYEKTYEQVEEKDMKLYINDKEISVTWLDNKSVNELEEEVNDHDVVVQMSMYGGNEQFGPLNKEYISDDTRITTECGDIVLYESNNIVVFYGSNTWEYTKLGKMNLSEEEAEELLGNGDVTLKLCSD